jgi:amidase
MFRGQCNAEQLVDAYLARIDACDQRGPTLNAVVTLNAQAREQARALDAVLRSGRTVGPLHGIPMVIKDCLETADMPTTAGSLALANNAPGRDAPIVARLLADAEHTLASARRAFVSALQEHAPAAAV